MVPHVEQRLGELHERHVAGLQQRFAETAADAGFEALVLGSGPARLHFRDDHGPAFRASAYFNAWAPVTDVPDAFIQVRPGARPQLLLPGGEDFWHRSAPPPPAWWARHFEVRRNPSLAEARRSMPPSLARTAYLGPHFAGLDGWGFASINPAGLLTRLDFDRAFKSEYEVECLREANRIGARGHRAAEEAFRAGGSEFEIELAFLGACRQREHELPYNPIIALNEAGATLHYQVLEREPPAEHRSLLIDAGASFAGFGSDITRTHCQAAGPFAELVAALDRLQLQLCAEVRPGVDWPDIHESACRAISALLADSGIVKTTAEHSAESGLTRVFFPHGIGHLLGLQVHDAGGLLADRAGGEVQRPPAHPFLRLTRRLSPGFVVTVEPGIYFIDSLLEQARGGNLGRYIDWARIAELKPFGGIRIEDDVLVTGAGSENLTRPAFAALEPG